MIYQFFLARHHLVGRAHRGYWKGAFDLDCEFASCSVHFLVRLNSDLTSPPFDLFSRREDLSPTTPLLLLSRPRSLISDSELLSLPSRLTTLVRPLLPPWPFSFSSFTHLRTLSLTHSPLSTLYLPIASTLKLPSESNTSTTHSHSPPSPHDAETHSAAKALNITSTPNKTSPSPTSGAPVASTVSHTSAASGSSSTESPTSPGGTHKKKPSFGDKLKGEFKVISGKLGHDEKKVAEGEKLKSGEL